MKFSIYEKNLNNWQGTSLIFGVVVEEIEKQLEKIKFVIDPKLLFKKITTKKFKRYSQQNFAPNKSSYKYNFR